MADCIRKVWCVQHRDGWCACKEDRDPGEADNVATRCENWVVLPSGIARRWPTCEECREELREQCD